MQKLCISKSLCLVSYGSFIHIVVCYLNMFTSLEPNKMFYVRRKDSGDGHVSPSKSFCLCKTGFLSLDIDRFQNN